MTYDPTETIRREQIQTINRIPGGREDLEEKYGKVWSTDQMTEEFSALGFLAPYVLVQRRSDKVKGTLMFLHNPRFYFSFSPK